MSATCRSCGAPIIWTVTPSGKRMPLDAEPTPNGNMVRRVQDDPRADPVAVSTSAVAKLAENGIAPPKGEPLYTSHFATCPSAALFRKPRR